jgi:hypothetical protein
MPARALFGRIVDLVVGDELGRALQGEDLGNRCGQRGFAVVDVADGADVDMRLGALKLLLCHCCLLLLAEYLQICAMLVKRTSRAVFR